MQIDKNVPPPVKRAAPITSAPRQRRYPFEQMAVGESVFYPDEPKGHQSNPAAYARKYGQRSGKVFTAKVSDGGVRIWRRA